MDNTGTLVISDISHPYILPVVLLIFFGIIILYNVYGLIAHHLRMERLSQAEGMILKGHKKLVANHEDLFVEGIGLLDENFMDNQISGNMAALQNNNAEEYRKRKEKAMLREKRREDKRNLKIAKAERKRTNKTKRKLTPEQELQLARKNAKRYEVCYKMLMVDANDRINKLKRNMDDVSPEDQRYFDYLTARYGSKIEKKELEERRQAAVIAAKKEEKKKHREQIRAARENADIDLFSGPAKKP